MEGEKWGMSLRMRMIIIELLINFCWFPITFATNPTVSTNVQIEKEKEREVVEEIQIESTWEERMVEVLMQILKEKIDTPPTGVVKTSAQKRQKIQDLSRHVNGARLCAQNILTDIKEINDTASKIFWETSAKSASEAKQLAEEAASLTKDVVDNLSKEKALATIASHITAQIGTNNRKTSQFYNSLKTTGIVLMKASNYQTIQLSNLESKLRLFRRDANRKVDAVRRSAEVYVKKTIKYLRLAQSYSSSSAKDEAITDWLRRLRKKA